MERRRLGELGFRWTSCADHLERDHDPQCENNASWTGHHTPVGEHDLGSFRARLARQLAAAAMDAPSTIRPPAKLIRAPRGGERFFTVFVFLLASGGFTSLLGGEEAPDKGIVALLMQT